jgi:homocysteine S-methyltransferase
MSTVSLTRWRLSVLAADLGDLRRRSTSTDDRVARWLHRVDALGSRGLDLTAPYWSHDRSLRRVSGCVVLDGGLATELSAAVPISGPALVGARPRRGSDADRRGPSRLCRGGRRRSPARATRRASRAGGPGFDRAAASRLLARSVELCPRGGGRSPRARRRVGRPARRGPGQRGGDTATTSRRGATRTRRCATSSARRGAAAAGPDLLAIETIPSVVRPRRCRGAGALADVPAWVSFSCRDGALSATAPAGGRRLDRGLEPAGRRGGVNCTPPTFVPELLCHARAITDRPGRLPERGGTWDARPRRPATRSPMGSGCWRWICGRPVPA